MAGSLPDQLTPYWDNTQGVFLGPNQKQAGSVETMSAKVSPSLDMFPGFQATGASGTIPLGIAQKAGTILAASVAAITPLTGNDTYTLDVKKNGVTILSAPIALLSSTAARVAVNGALTVTTCLPGDFFEAVATYTHGTGTAPLNVAFEVAMLEEQGSVTVPIGIATRAGIIKDVRVAAITPLTGNATYTVDVKQNGVTVLTAPMALLSGTAARASVAGALAVANTPVAVGDFFEAVIVSTPGTGTPPLNMLAQIQFILN